MDCCTRETLGWCLSRSTPSKTVEAALEGALINRFDCLGRAPQMFTLRSHNGLVFCSKAYKRLIRTIKERCVYHHCFENIRHAERTLSDRVQFYKEARPHQTLEMKSPSESFISVIRVEQIPLSHYRLILYKSILLYSNLDPLSSNSLHSCGS